MLEKLGAQNIAVCEKQGLATWIELSLKINDPKKTERLTGIQVLTNDFASLKIR